MAIRAADAGNYPWVKNASRNIRSHGEWDAPPREESREVVFY